MAYCEKCGTQLSEGEQFCPKCGNPCVNNSVDTVVDDENAGNTSTKKYVKIALCLIAILVLIGGGLYFFNNQSSNNNVNIVDSLSTNEKSPKPVVVDSMELLSRNIKDVDKLSSFKNGIAAIWKGEKIGIIDKEGKLVVPIEYDNHINSDENRNSCYAYLSEGLIRLHKGKYGFIDIEGKEVIPFNYEEAGNFNNGLANVQVDGKWGYINKSGKEVIPFIYDSAYEFHNGLAQVVKDNEHLYIDTSGKTIINLGEDYNDCGDFIDGIAYVSPSHNRYGFIDRKGNLIVPCEYHNINFYFYDGLMLVHGEDCDGYIDKTGKEVIPCMYGMAFDFHDGIAKVFEEYGGKKGHYINTKGEKPFEVDEENFGDYGDFFEGLATIARDGCGYIDHSGKIVIPCDFDDARPFQEGLAAVKKDGKWGYIDHSGKIVIPCKYDEAGQFQEGLAIVKKDGMLGYVDKKGNSTLKYSKPKKVENKDNSTKNPKKDAELEFMSQLPKLTKEIQQIMVKINNVYNSYMRTASTIGPSQSKGVNAVATISDLALDGDYIFDELISLARKAGKSEELKTIIQEKNDFDKQANQMENNINRTIY